LIYQIEKYGANPTKSASVSFVSGSI